MVYTIRRYLSCGDDAYPLINNMLIPYSGVQRFQEYFDVYILYLSRMRTCVETCFGKLTTKWRIFCSDLNYSTAKNALIVRVGAMLHKYVINEDSLNLRTFDNDDFESLEVEELEDWSDNMGYLSLCDTGQL